MFNLWQNPCILTARAQNKDWGSDLSTPSELLHEKSWLLKDVYIRQPGSFSLDSIFLYIIIYQNTPVRIYLGECPRGYTKLFLLPFPTGKVKAVTPLPWSMTFSACQVPVEFYLIFGHTVMVDFSSFFSTIWSFTDVLQRNRRIPYQCNPVEISMKNCRLSDLYLQIDLSFSCTQVIRIISDLGNP